MIVTNLVTPRKAPGCAKVVVKWLIFDHFCAPIIPHPRGCCQVFFAATGANNLARLALKPMIRKATKPMIIRKNFR